MSLGRRNLIPMLARALNAMADRLRASYPGVENDVGERRRTEERCSGVIASAMDGIITVNARGEIILVNPAAEVMFGHRAADLVGKPIEILFEAPGRTTVTNLASPAPGRLDAVTARRADGTELVIEGSVSQMGTGDERLHTMILRDITPRAAAEAATARLTIELQRRIEERDHAIKELEAFCYSVSHDLRAPLRAIDGYSRLAIEEHGNEVAPELKRYLVMCSQNALRMGQLIDDLLSLSKIGRQALTTSRVDVREQVRDCLASLETEREGRQVQIVMGELPPYDADPQLIRQVWLNLIGNALKYTGKTPAARIEIGSFLQADGTTVYYVRDNGAGFDMRYADRLFEVFQRLHNAADFSGTGVGLAIVARIVRRHGGRVWAEGEPGTGATFHFTLCQGQIRASLQAG